MITKYAIFVEDDTTMTDEGPISWSIDSATLEGSPLSNAPLLIGRVRFFFGAACADAKLRLSESGCLFIDGPGFSLCAFTA